MEKEIIKNDYYQRENSNMSINRRNSYSTDSTLLLGTNNINTYINNLETMNRNNPNKIISQPYNRPEDIANVIENFHKKTQ